MAVDAFALAGSAATGIQINESEKRIVTPLISCLVRGGTAVDCAKEAVIKQLPPETQQIARCVANGNNVAACGIQQLPPQTRELATCLASGTSVGACSRQFGQQQAASVLDGLQAEAANHLGRPVGVVERVVNVVQGILDEDWEKVFKNGGQIVASSIARAFLASIGGPLANMVAGDIIENVIAHRIDLAAGVIGAVRRNDPAALASVLMSAYLTMNALIPCTALGTLVPGDKVHEAICGTVAKLIGAISSGVGDVVGAAAGVIGDALELIGITGAIEDLWQLISGNKPAEFCGSREQYYVTHHAMCLQRAAFQKMQNSEFIYPPEFAHVVNRVNIRCRQHFEQCYDGSDKLSQICDPLKSMFEQQAEEVYAGLTAASTAFLVHQRNRILGDHTLCRKENRAALIQTATGMCETTLRNKVPLPTEAPGTEFCAADLTSMPTTAFQKACSAVAETVNQACDEVIRPAVQAVVQEGGAHDMLLNRLKEEEELKKGLKRESAIVQESTVSPVTPGTHHLLSIMEHTTPHGGPSSVGSSVAPPVSSGGKKPGSAGSGGTAVNRVNPEPARKPPPARGGSNGSQPAYVHDPAASAMVSGIIGTALGAAIRGGGGSGRGGSRPSGGSNSGGGHVNKPLPGGGGSKPGGGTPAPAFDNNINYGGCAVCGSKPGFREPN